MVEMHDLSTLQQTDQLYCTTVACNTATETASNTIPVITTGTLSVKYNPRKYQV